MVDIFSCINRERYWMGNTFRGLGSGGVMLAEPRMWSLHAEGHQSVLSLFMSQWCWPREQSQRACPGSKGSGLCRQGTVVGALPLGAGGLFSAFCLPCPCVSFPPPHGNRQASRAQGTSWVASSSTVPLLTVIHNFHFQPGSLLNARLLLLVAFFTFPLRCLTTEPSDLNKTLEISLPTRPMSPWGI